MQAMRQRQPGGHSILRILRNSTGEAGGQSFIDAVKAERQSGFFAADARSRAADKTGAATAAQSIQA
jgi:hypothetical protein